MYMYIYAAIWFSSTSVIMMHYNSLGSESNLNLITLFYSIFIMFSKLAIWSHLVVTYHYTINRK